MPELRALKFGGRPAFLKLAVVGLVVAVAVTVPVPLLVLEPGPAPNLSKRTELGAPTYPSAGSFHFTTTQIRSVDGVTALEAILAGFDPSRSVLPRESIYPPGISDRQAERAQAAQMTESQDAAAVAALKEIGLPYQPDGLLVTQVPRDSNAYGKVQPGDIIVKANEAPVTRLEEMRRAVAARRVGDAVTVTVRRGTEEKEVRVRTTDSGRRGRPSLGVMVEQHHKPPFEVKIDNTGIGGPSAGLMLALSIYDLLVPEDLTRGKIIAGTGTIENRNGRSGVVGKVGAIKQKVESARRVRAHVFLVPKAELEDAQKVAERPMRVIGVSTLTEAISALRKIQPT